jgi:hypothetical protein
MVMRLHEPSCCHLLQQLNRWPPTLTHMYLKFSAFRKFFLCVLFSATLSQNHTGWRLLYYINRKIRLHPVIWRRAGCKLVKYVGLQDTQLQTHNLCRHPLPLMSQDCEPSFPDKCPSSKSLYEPVFFLTHLNSLTCHFSNHHFPLCCWGFIYFLSIFIT